MNMRTTSSPFILVVLVLPLLSMASCTTDDVHDTQTTDGDATTGGCIDDSDCESGFLCQTGACVSDATTPGADADDDSAHTTDAVDASSITNDTIEGDGDNATDTDEGPGPPDAVDASGGTDTANGDDGDASGATDTFEGGNDTGSGNGDAGDLASCKKSCAEHDLECTSVCGGSPLCLAQCAAAYTDCNDACDAAFDG